ncbi:MAG: two-CW domain-containing protein [Candidatus Methylomirabilia bacterium]
MEIKLNCWEIKKCNRGPDGDKVHELGLCPVAVENKLDGVHGGSHAGRSCWVVAGSLCGGKVQGTFATKFQNCETCDVYATVRQEEFPNFQFSSTLLAMLRR